MNKKQAQLAINILRGFEEFKHYHFVYTYNLRDYIIMCTLYDDDDDDDDDRYTETILSSSGDITEFIRRNFNKARMHNALS